MNDLHKKPTLTLVIATLLSFYSVTMAITFGCEKIFFSPSDGTLRVINALFHRELLHGD